MADCQFADPSVNRRIAGVVELDPVTLPISRRAVPLSLFSFEIVNAPSTMLLASAS